MHGFSRRESLVGIASGTIALSAGCLESVIPADSDRSIVGEMELSNEDMNPHTLSVLIRTPDELVYWGSHEFEASDGYAAETVVLEGPWKDDAAPLTLSARVDDATAEGTASPTGVVTDVPLGRHQGGCIQARVAITDRKRLYVSSDTDDRYC